MNVGTDGELAEKQIAAVEDLVKDYDPVNDPEVMLRLCKIMRDLNERITRIERDEPCP